MREVYLKMMYPELESLPTTASEGFRRLCTRKKYAFFTTDMTTETPPCTVVRIPGTVIPSHLSMVVAKGSPYKGILDY